MAPRHRQEAVRPPVALNTASLLSLQVDGDLMLAPGFTSPPNSDYASYHQYIDDFLPPESPMLYGLHPNAEISSLTATSEKLFKTVFEMQPRDAMAGSGATVSRDEKVSGTCALRLSCVFGG